MNKSFKFNKDVSLLEDSEQFPKIHWHSGFYGGMEIELIKYKSLLSFDIEHELSKEPLRIDMLIIRKNSDVTIDNQIGMIFRKYNILEYKSPEDGLSIDDFINTVGYAFLYKGLGSKVNEIPLGELTVTIVREVYPRNLIKAIREEGGAVTRRFPGIYYVTELFTVPSQIIVTSELEGREHTALRIISRHAREEDVRQFIMDLKRLETQGDVNNANAVLQVSSIANKTLYSRIRRDDTMCQALMEIMKEEVDERVKAATDITMENNIRNIMDTLHLTADEAMDALKIPEEKRMQFVVKL